MLLRIFRYLKPGSVSADLRLVLLPICAAVGEDVHTVVRVIAGAYPPTPDVYCAATNGRNGPVADIDRSFGKGRRLQGLTYYCPNTFFRNARTSPCAFFMAASL
jgi:hypothetical protein